MVNTPKYCQVYCKRCYLDSPSITTDDFASSIFIRKLKKPEDASDKLGLTNTPNSPLSSDLVPEMLDNQVMYDPSVKPMERALIGQELNNDDDDSVFDDNCFSPNDEDDKEGINSKVPPSLSVNREGNNMVVDDSPPGLNTAIMTPNAGRHVSYKLKVKIKLMKIMPRVMKDIYATVPEIEGDDVEPHLIDWYYKKLIFLPKSASFPLLTNVMLVKEANQSFPHAEDPTLPVWYPELQEEGRVFVEAAEASWPLTLFLLEQEHHNNGRCFEHSNLTLLQTGTDRVSQLDVFQHSDSSLGINDNNDDDARGGHDPLAFAIQRKREQRMKLVMKARKKLFRSLSKGMMQRAQHLIEVVRDPTAKPPALPPTPEKIEEADLLNTLDWLVDPLSPKYKDDNHFKQDWFMGIYMQLMTNHCPEWVDNKPTGLLVKVKLERDNRVLVASSSLLDIIVYAT
eukprot:jgi/Psemu1/20123/gm1.20123_g